jgi:hypothetical protein
MKLRLFTRLALRAILLFSAASSVVVGCSGQGEGERCDSIANGNADCDDGLTCTSCTELAENIVDRCCRADGSSADPRCALSGIQRSSCLVSVGAGGSTSTAGTTGAGAGGSAGSGMGGMAGTSTAGTAGEDGASGEAGQPASDGGA